MAEAEGIEETDENVADAEDLEGQDSEESAESDGSPKPTSKLKLFIIIGGVVGILVLGGAGAYFAGLFDGKEPTVVAQSAEEEVIPEEIIYFNFPEILVNLNEPGRKGKFLKLTVVFELASEEDISLVEKLEPRIVDQFQMYLRELRFEDLQGSEGVYRLKEELLRRVNSEVGKDKVRDILFKNILVQ
jgi:flagellar FliL protein